ncbi:hypothetical protein GGI21_002652 [Coemansia aciculifera]|uniref:Uncharacterized protein n=1 Tax=Coemansia aciculifera TaxID=417176 RepID=A0ACC1M2W6_9FUNG|nr:hypothetical protein IWW38_002676 [Coemansia aciculifera]KAJ2908675.1 hypothetical protein GGI21_002652 [Coemansia aciculifera]
MNYSVNGKVVLVTGALAAVGRLLASTLVEKGARVVLVDGASDGSGEEFSDTLNALVGGEKEVRSIYIQTDLRQLCDIRVMVDASVLTFGRLDVLVNSAERYTDHMAGEEDAERISSCIDINLRAPILATWVFSRYLRESGIDGVVVNVTAMAGLLPGRGREVYGAAKAGLIHFTEASKALAPRIRVCALAPYYTDHPPGEYENERLLPGHRMGAGLLSMSSRQVVASVIRCIEDPRMAGQTLLVNGSSSYSHSWATLLSHLQMVFIVMWGLLVLGIKRVIGMIVSPQQQA